MSLDWIIFGLRLLSTAILYCFLGVAFYIVWRDLRATERLAAAESRPVFYLRVVVAVDNEPPVVGERLLLRPVTWLGRDPDNTIVLPDQLASGRHARICWQNGGWWLEDLGSRTGTTLNDLPVSRPTSLTENDLVGIGRLRFRVESS